MATSGPSSMLATPGVVLGRILCLSFGLNPGQEMSKVG